MEYAFEFDKINNICIVRVTGKLHSPEDSIVLERLALQIYTDHGYSLFLYDMTEAQIISGMMEAFQTADPPNEFAEKLRKFKGAILYSKLTDHGYFLETVAVNRGFAFKVFENADLAIQWLKSDT